MVDALPRFTPAWWLPGAHLQTLWVRLGPRRIHGAFQREVLTTPDDDDLILDHTAGVAGSPRVLLLHGLEGSAHSPHTARLVGLVARAGWRSTVLNFRSCARDPADLRQRLPNRRPRLYHSGETGDLDFVVRTLAAREPQTPLYGLGFSLGGNVLLKWLGEVGAASRITAAAVLSVPYDLEASSRFLERPAGRLYAAHFLGRLRAKADALLQRFPQETRHLDADRIRNARTIAAFDEHLTAPLHGFASATDYYQRSSSLGFLPRITIPTLCISAADDPLFPAEALARARDAASASVTFEVTPHGGHVGFIGGRWPFSPRYWGEESAVAWLAQTAEKGAGSRP